MHKDRKMALALLPVVALRDVHYPQETVYGSVYICSYFFSHFPSVHSVGKGMESSGRKGTCAPYG